MSLKLALVIMVSGEKKSASSKNYPSKNAKSKGMGNIKKESIF